MSRLETSRILYALAAVVTAASLVLKVRYILLVPSAEVGWDLHVTCVGLDAIRRGADPYLAGGGPFYYPYLFHVAWMSAPLCWLSPAGSLAYAWIYLGIMIGSVALAARALRFPWPDAVLLGAAAPSVLEVATWLSLTGNVEVLEVPLAAAVVVFLSRKRFVLAGAALAAMASFKLLPVVGLLAFPFGLSKREEAGPAVAAGLATFAIILAGNMVVMGDTRANFTTQLLGQIPRQYSATMEGGYGRTDPNIFEFASRLADAAGLQYQNVSSTGIAFLFLLLGASLVAIRQAGSVADPMWRTRLFCVFLLTLNLGLFRLKPYSYAAFIPFLLFCCTTSQRRVNVVLLMVALLAEPVFSALPLPFVGRLLHLPATVAARLPAMARVANVYSQVCGFVLLLGAILLTQYFEARPSVAPNELPSESSV
jgi:hypothetical protein